MNTTYADVIKAAIPNADEQVCDFILWGRTPFPAGKITAQSLYKAASGYHRAAIHNMRLCDFCERPAQPNRWTCESCNVAFKRTKEQPET